MARKIMTKKERKKARKRMITIMVVVICILGLSGVVVWKMFFAKDKPKQVQTIKILDTISEYGYSLSDNDSKYFKSEFEVLKKILDAKTVDQEAYATQVARLFTIDLYSMSTKVNKYDVGGMEYYYDTNKDMFEQKVIDTIYSTMSDNTYGDRKQQLPEVSKVETVSVEETEYMLGEEEVQGFLVKLNISYAKDMGYDTEASVVVCKEEGKRLSVVDFQPTLNPEY